MVHPEGKSDVWIGAPSIGLGYVLLTLGAVWPRLVD